MKILLFLGVQILRHFFPFDKMVSVCIAPPCGAFVNFVLFLIGSQLLKKRNGMCMRIFVLTHCILVGSSTVIFWTSTFVILGLSGLFCRFYSIFDGKKTL